MLVRFSPQGMTSEQYEAVKRRVTDAGHWPPEGSNTTSASVTSASSKSARYEARPKQLEPSGQDLMPILTDAGVTLAGAPEHLRIHNQERFHAAPASLGPRRGARI